ncbi:hypothetical protein BH24ACT5_BH24ACT5_22700 [soil metagenome]
MGQKFLNQWGCSHVSSIVNITLAPSLRRRVARVGLVAALVSGAGLATFAAGPAAADGPVQSPPGTDETIQFAPGTDHITVEGGVVLGSTNRYTLWAAAGQTMVLGMESVESNAVFTIWAPDGTQLSNPGVTNWVGTLPADGNYRIEVATIARNATYALFVQIVDSLPAAPVTPTGVNERVQFVAGTDNAVVSGAVVLGTTDRYILRAFAGQDMAVGVGSLEDNAVVYVYAPNGTALPGGGFESFYGTLPQDGDYVVEIATARGNASYAALIQITGEQSAPSNDNVTQSGGLITERVQFDPGTSGTTINSSLPDGTIRRYLVGAGFGQLMDVHITSTNGTAVFTVTGPDGYVMALGEADATLYLEFDGDYVIEVVSWASNEPGFSMSITIN